MTFMVRTGFVVALFAGVLASQEWTTSASFAQSEVPTKETAPLGLPPIPAKYSQISKAKIDLGRALFFERRLSFNNTLSCAMCHLEEDAFASTQSKRAIGFEGMTVLRNAPTLLNVVYQRTLFHDGRETHLDLQAWLPLLAHDEMANPSMGYVLDRINGLDDYAARFEQVYPGEGVSGRAVGDAIASFESTLLSANSRFDRWYFGRESGALTASEQAGFSIFTGKGGCSTCHTIGETSALFTDHRFHNTGIGYRASMLGDREYVIPLAPGVETRMLHHEIDSFGEKLRNDIGRFAVTLNESDRWSYKTPSLRNVSRTYPYMHDGSIGTLLEVVEYYSSGAAAKHAGPGSPLKRLDLSAAEKADLVSFLKSLDGSDQRAH